MRRPNAYRLPNWLVGVVAVLVIAIAMFLAATRELPWSDGHELRAVFSQTQAMTPGTPVRVAGVDVGEVSSIEHVAGDGAEAPAGPVLVTMEISEQGLPIHTDATMKIRPRLFLEGNYFIDLRPGSPGAPEAPADHTLALSQTAGPVQIDQVLTTLQADVRSHLRVLLDELGAGLLRHGGASGLRRFGAASAGAFESTAVVNQALLGTEPRDLSELIGNLQRVVGALGAHESQLQGVVSGLNRVSGALAAEGAALERAVASLPGTIRAARPTLAALSESLPEARAFAIEALPGVRALPSAIDATTPLLHQLRGLVSERELRGVAGELRPTIPELARLARGTLPLLEEARALSSCFNEVVVPWANSTVPDPETPATGTVFEETSYGLVGIAGESRSADTNGPYARVLGGSGTNLVVLPPFEGTTDQAFGVSPLPLLGARPALDSSATTPFRPDVACERQEPPDLDSGDAAPAPEQMSLGAPAGRVDVSGELSSELAAASSRLEDARKLLGASPGARSAAELERAGSLTDEALDGLDRALAEELGWEGLLELDREWERRRGAGDSAEVTP